MPIKRRISGKPNRTLVGRASAPQRVDNLLLVHVTYTGYAREIVMNGQLEKRLCPAFDTELLYFFALRPAYGKKGDADKSDQVGRFPAIFVIDPARLGPPHHVYPFDTGGALGDIFGDTPNPTVYLDDYELDTSLDGAAGHITWAFGDRRSYYRGDVLACFPDELAYFDEVGRSLISIAQLASSFRNAPDQRASSIELAYRRHVPLRPHCKLVIIPKQYLEHGPRSNDEMLETLSRLGIAYRTYDWQPNYCPADYRDILNEIVGQYLDETGAFDD